MQLIIDPDCPPTTFAIPGWERPAWATDVDLEQGHVSFTRTASVTPLVPSGMDDVPAPSPVYLLRGDTIRLDPATGTMSIEQGATVIYLGGVEELSVTEARTLAAALLELADVAEGRR